MTRRNIKLPDKASELILVALLDLERVEMDPAYEVDMDMWHNPDEGLCSVCLAGAVIATHGRASKSAVVWPWNYPGETEDKLHALDYFRGGHLAKGLSALTAGFASTASPMSLRVFDFSPEAKKQLNALMMGWLSYGDSPEAFKTQMRELAAILREDGY